MSATAKYLENFGGWVAFKNGKAVLTKDRKVRVFATECAALAAAAKSKTMSIQSTYWCKMEAGHYAKQVGSVRFDIEKDEEGSGLWHCRRNGIIFDSARTLREAKSYCVEPEGKPLIDIL